MNPPTLTKNTCALPNDSYLQKLLEELFTELMNEFNHYQNYSKRQDARYQVWDCVEIAIVSYLTHALRRMDPNYQRFIFMQEVGLENESCEAKGRADLIIQDLINNSAIIVEAKRHYSSPDAPIKLWKMEMSEKYYAQVMGQCKSYFKIEKSKLSAFKYIYSLTMAFDSVRFGQGKQYFNEWVNYKNRFNDEYYYFFSDTDEEYGLAIYGTYQWIDSGIPSFENKIRFPKL